MAIGILITFLLFSRCFKKSHKSTLESGILSFLLINAIVLISTALLSFFHALSAKGVKLIWITMALASGTICSQLPKKGMSAQRKIPFFKLQEILLFTGILCICLILLVKSVLSAPFSNDAQIYHLPRVMHWIQDHTVAPYPTHILRQLFNPPLSSFVQLHLYLLAGNDHLANLPQYVAMLLSLGGIWFISGMLGLNRTESLLATFLAACLPAGILIAPTALSDYSAALWVIGFVIYVLKYNENPKTRNLALALTFMAILSMTKIHPLLLTAPFVGLILIKAVYKKYHLNFIALFIFIIFLGFNWSAINTIHSKYVFSPFAQMSFVHPKWNILENFFRHVMMECTFPREDEDTPTNPLHTLLIISFFIYFLTNKNRVPPIIQKYVLLLLSGMLLSFLFLKASIWTGRFHLPFYLLFCPLLAHWIFRSRILLIVSCTLVFALGIYIALLYSAKPLLGATGVMHIHREQQTTFYDGPSSMFLGAAKDIEYTGCNQIGLIYENNIYQREYIIWQTLKNNLKTFRLEHVNVHNSSAKLGYPLGPFDACAVIDATSAGFSDTLEVNHQTMVLYKRYNPFVGLYLLNKVKD